VHDGIKYGVSAADQQKYSFYIEDSLVFAVLSDFLRVRKVKQRSQQRNCVCKIISLVKSSVLIPHERCSCATLANLLKDTDRILITTHVQEIRVRQKLEYNVVNSHIRQCCGSGIRDPLPF
jgi:hypothetical protein